MTEYLKHPKTSLHAKTIPGGKFPPTFKIDAYKGNPQFFVLTGMKKGEGTTYIRAAIEPKTLDLICEAIHYIADLPVDPENNIIATFECKQGKEKELVSKVAVGKAKTGKMFISVIDAKNTEAPMIQFFFSSDMYHPVVWKSLPTDIDHAALTSCLAAKGWAKRTQMYFHQVLLEYQPEEKENKPNNNYSKGTSSVTDTDLDDVW